MSAPFITLHPLPPSSSFTLMGVRRRGVRTHQTLLCSWKGREEATCRFSPISSADGFSQEELTQFAWAFITGTTRSRLTKQCKCSLFMSRVGRAVEELFNCSQCSADITWAFWKEQKDLCHMVQKSVQISGSQFLGDATLTPQKLLNLTVYFERKKILI